METKRKDFQTTENTSTWNSSEPKYMEGVKRKNVDSNPQKRLFPSVFPPQSMLWSAGGRKKKGTFLFPDHQSFSWSTLMAQLCSTEGVGEGGAGVKGLKLKMTVAALILIAGWDF